MAACLLGALALAGVAGFTGHLPAWGLSASLAVEGEPTVTPGGQVNITYEVRNLAPAPYTYTHPGCGNDAVQVEVRGLDADLRLYAYGEPHRFGPCALRDVTLWPGDTVEATVTWNGYDTADRPDPHGGDPVPAGNHTVAGSLQRADGGPVLEATTQVQVTR